MPPSARALPSRIRLVPIVTALAVCLFLIAAPRAAILGLANDDAFYYFQIAHNTVTGHGVTFDGRTPTNGFHPLYFFTLLPIFAVPGLDPLMRVRLAYVLLAGCYFATAIVLERLLRRTSGERAAGFACLAWTFNPLALFFARGGVEVPLYVLLAAILSLEYASRFVAEPRPGRAFRLGVIAGLMLLARTDSVLFLAGVAIDAAVRWSRDRRPFAGLPGVLGSAAIGATLPLLPWLAWNLATFGSVVQISAAAHRFAAHPSDIVSRLLATLLRSESGGASGVLAAVAGCAVLTGALVLLGRAGLARVSRLAFLAIYLALFVGVTVGWYGFYRNWYFLTPSMALVALTAAALIPEARPGFRAKAGMALAGALWLAMVAIGTKNFVFQYSSAREGGMQPTDLSDIRRLDAQLPAGAVMGSFNSGRLGYFLDRRVVNLDGVVNHGAVAAFRSRGLDRYLRDQGIDYVFDSPGYVQFYFDRYSASRMDGLRPIDGFAGCTLYEVTAPIRDRGGAVSAR